MDTNIEQAYKLRIESRGPMLAAPQFAVAAVGPAGRDCAVYQAHSPLDHLDGVLGGRYELLQDCSHNGYQFRDYPRDGGLRDTTQITEKLLRAVVPDIHARDFNRMVQAAGPRAAQLLRPGLGKRLPSTPDEFLHLRRHQACSTIVAQRSLSDDSSFGWDTSSISSRETVAQQARGAI